MSTERFVARDSKSALEKVKSKLGADALILSTKRSDAGVEITAITGDSSLTDAAQAPKIPSNVSVNDITLGYLDRELRALREVLYKALGERAWQDVAGKQPVLAALEQRLFTLGLSKSAIEVVTSNIDTTGGLNVAWSATLNNLMLMLDAANVAGSVIDQAPKVILGGSGNCRSLICRQLITTALQSSKPSQILVVSATQDPSGALIDFCKRVKVKRIHVSSMQEARRCLQKSGRRKKIIVETGDLMPSLGTNDPIFDLFNDPELGIKVIAVMPAIHQSEILSSVDQHIRSLPISGCIISRISDAVSLGAILDVLILSEMPLVGVSRPSESVLQPMTSSGLIKLAKRLARDRVEGSNSGSTAPAFSRTA
jgi:flagellar biosynthesis protein FlhF